MTEYSRDNIEPYRAKIVAEANRRREARVNMVARATGELLEQYDIHLNADRFNDLDDYLGNLIASIEENGE